MDETEIRMRCLEYAVRATGTSNPEAIVDAAEKFVTFAERRGTSSGTTMLGATGTHHARGNIG